MLSKSWFLSADANILYIPLAVMRFARFWAFTKLGGYLKIISFEIANETYRFTLKIILITTVAILLVIISSHLILKD